VFDSSTKSLDNGYSDDQLQDRVTRLERQVAEIRAAIGLTTGNGKSTDSEAAIEPARTEIPPAKPAPPASLSIEEWFKNRGFSVEIAEDNPVDQVFDRFAEYLGDNFSDLERLLRGLVWSLREGRSRRLTPQTDGERVHCVEFGRALHDIALLSDFHVNRNNGSLFYKTNENQRFQQFLEGYWLERYVLSKARQRLEKSGVDFSVARNLELQGSDGRFEMDVFLLVQGSPIWIECKSRNYQQHIDRYVQRGKGLGIPLDQTMLVVQSFESQNAEGVAKDLRLMHGLSVTPTSQFPDQLDQMLSGIMSENTDQTDLASRLSKCLDDAQMSPHPEARQEILSALAAFPEEDLPSTVRDIREAVKARVSVDHQPFVHPVLMAVRRGGGMIGSSGRAYIAMRMDAKIVEFTTRAVPELEALCRGAYEETISRKLPTLTELPEFPETLKELVDGSRAETAS
jgi:hypothetical protein